MSGSQGWPRQDAGLRRQWRRRGLVLLVSALVWVPALVFAGNLVSASDSSDRAAERYASGDYGFAVSVFMRMDGAGPFERWKARFNHGTALVARGRERDPVLAIEQLDEALDLAPDDDARCTVQQNRAIAYELAGDADMAASEDLAVWLPELREAGSAEDSFLGELFLGDVTFEELEGAVRALAGSALYYYENALEARTDPRCPPPTTPEQKQAQDRVEGKVQDAETASGLREPDGDGPQTEQEREAELIERNQDAEAETDAERQEDAWEEGGSNGDGPARGW